MREVTVTVKGPSERTEGQINVLLEGKRGEIWNRVKSFDVSSKGESFTYMLADNQRLVIEPVRGVTDVVYNPEQMAAQTRPAARSDESTENKKFLDPGDADGKKTDLAVSEAELLRQDQEAKRQRELIEGAKSKLGAVSSAKAPPLLQGVSAGPVGSGGLPQGAGVASRDPNVPTNVSGARSSKEVT